jgi:hypothetical protein
VEAKRIFYRKTLRAPKATNIVFMGMGTHSEPLTRYGGINCFRVRLTHADLGMECQSYHARV